MHTGGAATLLILLTLAFLVWAFAMYNVVKMIGLRRHDVGLWKMLNPYTLALYRRENLRPEALPYRRNAFIAMAVLAVLLISSIFMT